MEIGKNLKKLRELRNYKQEYVAEKLGISQVSYSRLENGKTRLDTQKLISIAQILEVDIMLIINLHKNQFFKNFNPNISQSSSLSTYEQKDNLEKIYHLEKENEQLKNKLSSLIVDSISTL
jgi:transcriptional regulator with XRE-family HTH domain